MHYRTRGGERALTFMLVNVQIRLSVCILKKEKRGFSGRRLMLRSPSVIGSSPICGATTLSMTAIKFPGKIFKACGGSSRNSLFFWRNQMDFGRLSFRFDSRLEVVV